MAGKHYLETDNSCLYRLRKRIRDTKGAKTVLSNKTESCSPSRYHRSNASERERSRMKKIKEAYYKLQMTLPEVHEVDLQKLTKYSLLRLTIAYVDLLLQELESVRRVSPLKNLQSEWSKKYVHLFRTEYGNDDSHLTSLPTCDRSYLVQDSAPFATLCTSNTQIMEQRTVHADIPSVRTYRNLNKEKLTSGSDVNKFSERHLHTVKKVIHRTKRGRPRTRGRVCRTNSIQTKNGAFITLKNCARQTSPPYENRADNKPMIFNMLLKKSRIEPVVGNKSTKMKKYEPSLSYSVEGLRFGTKKLPEIKKLRTRGSLINTADRIEDSTEHSLINTILKLPGNFNKCVSTNETFVSAFAPMLTSCSDDNKMFLGASSSGGLSPPPSYTAYDAPNHRFESPAIINDYNHAIDNFSHAPLVSGNSVASDSSHLLCPFDYAPYPDLDDFLDESQSNSPTETCSKSTFCSSIYAAELTSLSRDRALPSKFKACHL